jgi:tetratricopeptide (TPR) repeat protein
MKKIILTVICLAVLSAANGQEAKEFYAKGLENAQAGKLDEAIKLFSKSIELQPEDYYSWFNRGIAKNMQGYNEEALLDFDQTVKLAPEFKKGYLNRGTAKKRMTDYEGALSDYSYAIKIDSNYADAYFNRGLVYEMLGKKDSACIDFNKAKELGNKNAQKKVDKCNDTTNTTTPTNSILRLTKTADNDQYGYTQENPIKVGSGPDGGPANQRAYLNLLRDAQGKSIKYERLGSCCPYKSENGLMGSAMLDKYEITFINEKDKETTIIVYMSFYDYEEPMVIYGFKTVGLKYKAAVNY